jgi:hypothetical protein
LILCDGEFGSQQEGALRRLLEAGRRCPGPGCALKVPHTQDQIEFCHSCGARIPPILGEGTCPACQACATTPVSRRGCS